MKRIKPRRVIDYLHRGKARRYVINIEQTKDGYIRLDYPDININREHNFEWVKFRPEKLIREYLPNDSEHKYIISLWWSLGRKYVKRLQETSISNIGSHYIRDMFKESVKELEK